MSKKYLSFFIISRSQNIFSHVVFNHKNPILYFHFGPLYFGPYTVISFFFKGHFMQHFIPFII